MKELWLRLKNILTNRLLWLSLLLGVLLILLWRHLFMLQVVSPEHYVDISSPEVHYTVTSETQGVRGEIFDRYGRTLASNQYTLTLYYDSSVKCDDLNEMCHRLDRLLHDNGLSPVPDFAVGYSEEQGFYYLPRYADNAILRILFLAEIHSKSSVDLTNAEKRKTAEEAYLFMRDELFEIPADRYTVQETLEIMRYRYAIYIQRFKQEVPILIADDVPEPVRVTIYERQNEYPGFYCQVEESRVYPEGVAFAHIIGYLGSIPEASYASYEKRGYGPDDLIGRSGLEAVYETSLRGRSGQEEITYNRLTDEEISRSTVKEASRGDNLYLSIDADLQKAMYNALKEKVKSMLCSKITGYSSENGQTYSATDVVVSMMENGAVSASDILYAGSPYAGKMLGIYEEQAEKCISELTQAVLNPDLPLKDYDPELMDIYNIWIEIMRDARGVLSNGYQQAGTFYEEYRDGEKSAYEFLEFCVYNNFFDLDYYGLQYEMNADVVVRKIVEEEAAQLVSDRTFRQELVSRILRNGLFTSREFLEILYDIGYLSDEDGSRERFSAWAYSPEDILILKIRADEIPASDVSLDPSSASAVITDTKTGEVLAIASYPSYDNNRITADADYYQYIVGNTTSPLVFRALEEARAPGSTFKLCTSIASLECGVVGEYETIYDNYRFMLAHSAEKPTCYTVVSHGDVDMNLAIQESCNYYFYTLGYRLCEPVNEEFEDSVGLRKLAKYARDLGLATKTNIEIDEADPHASDQDAVRSAIGQGTNAFTIANINRYTSTVANAGEVYNLYLVKRAVDYSGQTVFETKPVLDHTADVDPYSFRVVQRGMVSMATSRSNINQFISESGMRVAGKTGTAQEYNDRPDHSLFTGYTYDEEPDITISVIIPFGGNSANALSVFLELGRIYYGLETAANPAN